MKQGGNSESSVKCWVFRVFYLFIENVKIGQKWFIFMIHNWSKMVITRKNIFIRKPNLVTSNGYKVFEFLKLANDVIIYDVTLGTLFLWKSSKTWLFRNRVFRLDRISKCLMGSFEVAQGQVSKNNRVIWKAISWQEVNLIWIPIFDWL